jgi:hypothetical protein
LEFQSNRNRIHIASPVPASGSWHPELLLITHRSSPNRGLNREAEPHECGQVPSALWHVIQDPA